MTRLESVVADLGAEQEQLDAIVETLASAGWEAPTPADGWTIKDQIGHLAYFDDVATEAIADPPRFAERVAMVRDAVSQNRDPMEEHLRRGRALPGHAVLSWWRVAREAELQAFATLEGSERVPWFGPHMGAVSFVTARLMETWAHGQDVVDALAVRRAPTDRLRHVAHLGVRTFASSFVVHGLDVPAREVRVELVAPSGETWTWGPEGVLDRVRGTALDFCLVVTQRRHVEDTGLELSGVVARSWMAFAQAFAGPPGPGRLPTGAR